MFVQMALIAHLKRCFPAAQKTTFLSTLLWSESTRKRTLPPRTAPHPPLSLLPFDMYRPSPNYTLLSWLHVHRAVVPPETSRRYWQITRGHNSKKADQSLSLCPVFSLLLENWFGASVNTHNTLASGHSFMQYLILDICVFKPNLSDENKYTHVVSLREFDTTFFSS